MAIELHDNDVVFTCSDATLPSFRHPVVGWYAAENGKLVAAVWKAEKVPYLGKDPAYFVYEEVSHPSRSQYVYWHANNLAGCLLKQSVRQRMNLTASYEEILDQLFDESRTHVEEIQQ